MEEELLNNHGNITQLKTILSSKRGAEIISFVHKLLSDAYSDKNLQLLELVTCGVYGSEELLEICEVLVDRLWLHSIHDAYLVVLGLFLSNCVELLEDWKVERFSVHIFQKLSIDCVESDCIFETLGKGLVRLEHSTNVLTPSVKSLCDVDWSVKNTERLLASLKGYPFSMDSRILIIQKSLSMSSDYPPEDIGLLIQAVLPFSCPKTLSIVFDHLHDLFSNQSPSFNIKQSVLSILTQFCTESEQFRSNLVTALKALTQPMLLREFVILLLLSVLPIRPLQPQALSLLNSGILSAFSDRQLISESSFLRDLCDAPDDPVAFILNLVDLCSHDSENCIRHGLTLLGFGLLRTVNSTTSSSNLAHQRNRRPPTAPRTNRQILVSPFAHQNNAKASIFRLGIDILVRLFQHSPVCREDIITVTTNMLWSESSKPIAFKLVALLSELVAVNPMEVVNTSTNQLDPVLDSIGLLPLEIATGLVHALLPLIRAGSLLPDTNQSGDQSPVDNPILRIRARLFSTLCKAAHSPRIETRRQAVACFMLLLKHLKVSVSAFRSASQSGSSSLSQCLPLSQIPGSTQQNPAILYTQLQCTQIARQAIVLPCDVDQNEALCTQIVGILHRIIFSAFFRSQVGSLLEDPGSQIKADIYWGLCEVVTRNKGLCEPVLNMYLRLVLACLSPNFLRELKARAVASMTVIEPSQLPSNDLSGPAVSLEQIIQPVSTTSTEIQYSEHPDILIWCLQLIITLPQFDSSWKRYRLKRSQTENSNHSESESQSTCAFSQFTQSTLGKSIECGRSVSSSLFTKTVTTLLSLSDSLRSTPLDDFNLSSETDFGSSMVGKVNLKRAELLLALYDACLEFELKDPLELINASCAGPTQPNDQTSSEGDGWIRIRHLYARRSSLLTILNSKLPGSMQQHVGLVSLHVQRGHSRIGLLMMALLSATQTDLSRLLTLTNSSTTANSLAHYVLQIIHSRLQQLVHGHVDGIPYSYRDGLLQIMIPLLRHVIRFYNHKVMNEDEVSCKLRTQECTTTTEQVGVETITNQSKPRTADACFQALSVFESCFILLLDFLGTDRLHSLSVKLYRVINDPSYPQSVRESLDGVSEDVEYCEDADVTENDQMGVSPAQALSALIKLIKTWVTKLLSPASLPNTQKSQLPSRAKDLIILLPLLIRLCRVRAKIASSDAGCVRASPYTGLDRVLSWLLRLMRSPCSDPTPLPNIVRVQLINQAVWLSHLVVPCVSSSSKHKSKNDDKSLDLEYILPVVASDLRSVMGDATELQESGFLPAESRSSLTFHVITRSAAPSILPLLFSVFRSLCSEFEWILNRWTPNLGNRLSQKPSITGKAVDQKLDHHHHRDEETLCHRLMSVGLALAELLQAAVPAPSANADSLLEVSTRVFKLFTQLVKYYLRIARSRCGRFPVIFERLVGTFGRVVSPNAYSFISYIQHLDNEKIKSMMDSKKSKKTEKQTKQDDVKSIGKKSTKTPVYTSLTMVSRSIKDSRLIPQLIFAIEQFEQFLMQLSKISKVNLMRNIKLAVSRDFRINSNTVMARLETSAALAEDSLSDVDDQDGVGMNEQSSNIEAECESREIDNVETMTDIRGQSSSSSRSVVDLQLNDLDSENQTTVDCDSVSNVRTPAWDRAVRPNATRLSAIKRSHYDGDQRHSKRQRPSFPLSPKNT